MSYNANKKFKELDTDPMVWAIRRPNRIVGFAVAWFMLSGWFPALFYSVFRPQTWLGGAIGFILAFVPVLLIVMLLHRGHELQSRKRSIEVEISKLTRNSDPNDPKVRSLLSELQAELIASGAWADD